ncbi:MAG: alpha/beta fold hydrolase [Verrucomicrobiaceae bacterium]
MNFSQKNIEPVLGKTSWRSFDGKEMPWLAREVPRGESLRAVVITVHGLSGAASDFWPLGEAWPPHGIAVYGMELRGQGNDPELKSRGDIVSAEQWQKDLLTFHQLVTQQHPGVPVFWYAESLGALVALHAVEDLMGDRGINRRPAGIVFSSPAAGLKMKPGFGKRFMIHAAMVLMPGKKVNLEKLAGVKDKDIRVTQGTTHEAQMAKTPHYVSEFTLRLLHEVQNMMDSSPQVLREMKVPALVLASPNDVIASPAQIQRFYDDMASGDKTIIWYEQSYHLLLHDVQRGKVLHDATEWMMKRSAGH